MSMSDPAYQDGSVRVYLGDALDRLREMDAESVQTCITSPPYFGLRDYGTAEWVGGDAACDHKPRRWDGPKQTQGAMSAHAAKGDRLDRRKCECGASRVDAQLGLEPTPDCGLRGKFRLRSDLSEAQREYVVRRLLGGERRDV